MKPGSGDQGYPVAAGGGVLKAVLNDSDPIVIMAYFSRIPTSFRKILGRRGAVLALLALFLGAGLLSACSGADTEDVYPRKTGRSGVDPYPTKERETVFGPGGYNILEGLNPKDTGGGSGIGVNGFLWRASLDTVSFMPLASADPFGGVIITDWYSPPETPKERFKMTVYILDRRLRADGLKVAVFRQLRDNQEWRDATTVKGTATKLENAILQRARELRLATLGE